MKSKENRENPLLHDLFAVFEGIAPGGLNDPAKALCDLVPKLRFLVVGQVEQPTVGQLKAIQIFDKGKTLVQIRKALASGGLEFGPFPGDLAQQSFVPQLIRHGLSVSLRELTDAERTRQLQTLD